ncbi:hypothetical protein N7474_002751 [Penicillium riverlandense]|uniref:uncharacterized protein n=1 Tax=Penicillium riverlandense TaxID=1903569 RepID=UPI0025479D93|nr:uncharacterized protein N7474_002751 [Penicillium riverlandense]KAJ5825613.1 hypothetical protein N7474_002751 [Penicillium riverlandense]
MDDVLKELAARYAALEIHDDTPMKIDNLVASLEEHQEMINTLGELKQNLAEIREECNRHRLVTAPTTINGLDYDLLLAVNSWVRMAIAQISSWPDTLQQQPGLGIESQVEEIRASLQKFWIVVRDLYPRVPEHLIECAPAYWMDFLEAISIILQIRLSQIFNDAFLRSGITDEQEGNPVVE